ncbi:MAG: S8 family serine peptidase [Bacteroidales bacterium]|jgi:subtilisin family serine protease|nr:S8 family serine peptidase [Bacteroidales bacterium]
MKKIYSLSLILVLFFSLSSYAQNYYWVFFKDKANTEFDPYEYFDSKAIERRIKNNISLYDISDYPLNSSYVDQVSELSDEYIGETRWFNAIAISTSEHNIEYIRNFDFVKEVVHIYSDMQPAHYEVIDNTFSYELSKNLNNENLIITPQIERFQGRKFREAGIDGKGLRIAVFDGGFPNVDNHVAFKHLRDNNQIIKTWNFPKKQENVYGWNSHGTSVLSCIAGINPNGELLGLATGAEFLLARTEVGPEPGKEEVWWLQAVEWADKNGADIINSSLGYGIERHYPYEMDGKTTIVTKAANMAASKGILVCNSAGNEGSSKNWLIIGAPADADSILSIGGIATDGYRKIYFSSVGPTADGRMKPNVCAFGEARVANKKNPIFGSASGTSFSSPLVAGFVACAWQTKRELTAMEMKKEIEKSADLYPYFDYSFGYGVPQASYFTNNKEKEIIKTFDFEVDSFLIAINTINRNNKLLFYHIENSNGVLDYYTQIDLVPWTENNIKIKKSELYPDKTLTVLYDGYVSSYKLDEKDITEIEYAKDNNIKNPRYISGNRAFLATDVTNQTQSRHGVNSKYSYSLYISYGMMLPSNIDEYSVKYGKSNNFIVGLRYKYNIKKWYNLGCALEYNKTNYFVKDFPSTVINPGFLQSDMNTNIDKQKFNIGGLNFEIYQRFRFLAGGMPGFGLYLDTGIYGNWAFKNEYTDSYKVSDIKYNRKALLKSGDFNCGARVRLGYEILAIYGQYRFTDILQGITDLPKFSMGLELTIPLGS